MKKGAFVSSGLHNIRGKISEATTGSQPDQVGAQDQVEPAASPAVPDDPETRKAVAKRLEDYRRLKKEIQTKLVEMSSKISTDYENHTKRASELDASYKVLEELEDKIELVDDANWTDSVSLQNLAPAMKTLEDSRLELVRIHNKLHIHRENSHAPKHSAGHEFIHEINSLTIFQLLRFGTLFFMPLIAGFIITGIIVALAILIAMKV